MENYAAIISENCSQFDKIVTTQCKIFLRSPVERKRTVTSTRNSVNYSFKANLLFPDYNGASCPRITQCPPRSAPCKTDNECLNDELCCDSPCGGPICVQRLYTGCQQMQSAARRRAKSLGDEGRSVRIPRCSKDGSFEPIQCDNEINSSCWCVDEEGFELPGTRAPAAGMVNCTG